MRTYSVSSIPTPGFVNSKEGYVAYEDSQLVPASLIINEAMVSNNSYVPLPDNQYCSWIELKNNSLEDICLSDYYISNSSSDRLLYQLPDVTLAPGECFLVYCDDNVTVKDDVYRNIKASDYVIAPFTLSCSGENVWLTLKDNSECIDCISLRDVPVNGSYGRMENENGFFYFETPSPNEQNIDGKRFVTESPKASQCSGVYDDVENILIELSGDAEFKDAFLRRYAAVSKTVLSDENVLSTIERLAAIVAPEIERDLKPGA